MPNANCWFVGRPSCGFTVIFITGRFRDLSPRPCQWARRSKLPRWRHKFTFHGPRLSALTKQFFFRRARISTHTSNWIFLLSHRVNEKMYFWKRKKWFSMRDLEQGEKKKNKKKKRTFQQVSTPLPKLPEKANIVFVFPRPGPLYIALSKETENLRFSLIAVLPRARIFWTFWLRGKGNLSFAVFQRMLNDFSRSSYPADTRKSF